MISKEWLTEQRNELDDDQVFDFLEELGAEPIWKGDTIVCCTCCHNGRHKGSHKLFYYPQNKMFRCYTDCENPLMDIYELNKRVKSLDGQNLNYITSAIDVLKKFNIQVEEGQNFLENEISPYLQQFQRYNKIQEKENKSIELKEYCGEPWLNNLPQPRIKHWEDEGISYQALKEFNIRYDPSKSSIVIPHKDINDRLIGIRQRTVVEENEIYGKYLPYKRNGIIYRHMLGFNLYGIDKNRNNIAQTQHTILVESEKAVLQYESYFGRESNISLAVCGSSISAFQINLLLSLGVKHITVCFDKAGSVDAAEITKYVKKFYTFYQKYSSLLDIDFIYDKDNEFLDLKENPLDKGKDIFLQMYERRIRL